MLENYNRLWYMLYIVCLTLFPGLCQACILAQASHYPVKDNKPG